MSGSGPTPRHGLVLGAGGVLGFTWMVAALHAWEQRTGVDARDVEVRIGTSAGSILAGLLGIGVSVEVILRHQQGRSLIGDAVVDWDYDIDSGSTRPTLPRPGLGSPSLLLAVARHPRRIPPLAVMSAVLPRGQAHLDPVARMLARLSPGDAAWPERETWIVAMDYETGRRAVFGREGSPPARLSEAVQASCSIPGWYAPVRIGRHSFVDGGTLSPTSADLLAGAGLDQVTVLAPLGALEPDRPRAPLAVLERRWRRVSTRRMLREVEKVQTGGTEVAIRCPGPAELTAMGANLMDHRRRRRVLEVALRTQSGAAGSVRSG